MSGDDEFNGTSGLYSKERVSSISDCDEEEEEELHEDPEDDTGQGLRRHSIHNYCSTSSVSSKSIPTTPDANSSSKV